MTKELAKAWLDPAPGESSAWISADDVKSILDVVYADMAASAGSGTPIVPQHMVVHYSPTAPVNPRDGDLWVSGKLVPDPTVETTMHFRWAGAWRLVTRPHHPVYHGAAAPTGGTVTDGDLWVDVSSAMAPKLKILVQGLWIGFESFHEISLRDATDPTKHVTLYAQGNGSLGAKYMTSETGISCDYMNAREIYLFNADKTRNATLYAQAKDMLGCANIFATENLKGGRLNLHRTDTWVEADIWPIAQSHLGCDALDVTGNLTTTGTFHVARETTLADDLTVTGNTVLNGTIKSSALKAAIAAAADWAAFQAWAALNL